jgi:hypothetical protein
MSSELLRTEFSGDARGVRIPARSLCRDRELDWNANP